MKKILSTLSIITSVVFANPTTFNIQLTNSTIGGYFETGVTQENIKVRGMYLYNDHSDKKNFYSAGLKAEGNLIGFENSNMRFSLITDFMHTNNNSAIAIGVGVFSFIPQINLPIFVRVEGEYAPKVLSFDDANRASKIDMNVGYFPIENGEVFIGYRNITFNHNYNSVSYVGIGYSF